MAADIPRGIEVLVKKASVDPEFRELLLEKRAEATEAIGLELAAEEAQILGAIPRQQLQAIIAGTKVDPGHKPAFLGKVAAAMLAALGVAALPGCWTFHSFGIAPDHPPDSQPADKAEEGESAATSAALRHPPGSALEMGTTSAAPRSDPP